MTDVLGNARTAAGQVPPRTAYEEAVVAIWRDILHRSDIGVFDNFFDLDGHSLLVMQVLARVRKTFGVEIPVKTFFASPTVAAVAAAVAAQGTSPSRPPLTPRSPGAEPVLSFDQQRLWLENQLRPGAAYNVHGRRRLVGELDVAALERSIRAILGRHEALRTRFPVVDGVPVQVVDAADEQWRIAFEDLSGAGDDRYVAARRLADEHATRLFDLAQGPLFRCQLIRHSDTEHLLSITMHHIVSDGWSVGLFLRELSELYRVGGDVHQADLPALPVQYRDFAAWQRSWLAGEALEAQLDHWRRQLVAAPPALALPAARRRSRSQGRIGGRARSSLSGEQTAALHELCRAHGVTPFMVLLAALATVLGRWSGQSDVVIGAPVATRNDAGTDNLIGFFVNTIPMRVDLSGDPTFAGLLGRVRQVALDGYANGDAPFDVLVNELQPPRDPTRTPLFQAILNMVDVAEENTRIAGVEVEIADTPVLPSKFDLTLSVREFGGAIHFDLAFHGDRYDDEMVRLLLDQFCALIGDVAADPTNGVMGYPLLSPAHVVEPARAPESAPHHAVEWCAVRQPDRVAVTDAAGEWSYRQLSRAVDKVTHALAEQGTGSSHRMGVVKRRSAGFVATVLGCMKAGVPFSVVQPPMPGAPRHPYLSTVLDPDPETTPIDGVVDLRDVLRGATDEPPRPDDMRPDAGMDWAVERFNLTGDDRFAVLSGSSGHTMSALATAFGAGARLSIPDGTTAGDVGAQVEWLRTEAVSAVYLNPPLLRAVTAHDPAPRLPMLRYVFVDNTGDLTDHDVEAVRRLSTSCRFVAVYRVTRTGQPLAAFAVPDTWRRETAPLRVPLGTEVDGVPATLLNPGGQLAGTGEVGELCFAGEPTGDLGRRLLDGTLEYVGSASANATAGVRADPAETVAALRDVSGVHDALVTEDVDIDGRTALIAYVASHDRALSAAGLRQRLVSQVPEYLVPEHVVLMERMPLTPDGDYDLAALPDPGDRSPEDTYVAPRTPIERRLTEIFEELVDVDRVGVHDTFFELNGFSLLATQLVARVREEFRFELSLRDVFGSPTVEGLAQLVVGAQAEMADTDELEALLAEIE